MGRIIELSQHVANQIAAGEVIERPASVVKELVENALDADAKNIEVRIKDGGFAYIIVADDGSGMDEDDVKLAVKRYATSKLATVSDLHSLSTFGFRGEALPSIASISMMSIATKMAHQELGVKALIDAGTLRDVYTAQTALGTRIEVRDLFYNVPARLKFARSQRAEANEIDRLMRTFAFAHHNIGWKFFVDNHQVFSVSNEQSELSRASLLLGRDTEGHLFPFSAVSDVIEVTGVLASPLVIRKDSRNMVFFVNDRIVSDKKLVAGVKTAFRSLLEVGRHPVCALKIAVAPDLVDVNVHPRKAEVRFSDERRVMGHLIGMVNEFLSKTPWLNGGLRPSSLPTYMPPAASSYQREDFDYLLAPRESSPDLPSFGLTLRGVEPPMQNSMLSAQRFSDLKVVGQIRSTYLVTESEQGLVVIDQHAAHERIMYERIRNEKPHCDSQPLLIPISVNLSFAEMGLFEDRAQDLAMLGFEVFGKDTVIIRSLPRFLEKANASALLKDILHDLAEWDGKAVFEKLFAHLCATLACHAAIRAGQRLSKDEIAALLNELEDTDFHAHCPHGRPIVKSFSAFELKRWFDRT